MHACRNDARHLPVKRAVRNAAVATIAQAVFAIAAVAHCAGALAAPTARATMKVSATVLATGCPAGKIAASCMQPLQSVSRVDGYAAATQHGRQSSEPSEPTAELFLVTLTY
jgi:hypothetical protein